MRRPWLAPLMPLYRFGLSLREHHLRSGAEPVRRLRWPVVSIGNLSTGGTGKTPLTIALAKLLTAQGVRVDVLSRGYGRRSAAPLRVDPSGSAERFGDEPLLIAREAGVPVYVAAERYEAGLMAEAETDTSGQPRADVSHISHAHILDDGFQHRQLARDVDILLLNWEDAQDSLLPAGNLREPQDAAKRASVIAIPANEPELEPSLRAWGWEGPVWRLRRQFEPPEASGPVAAFCGIARPEQFFAGLEEAGLAIATRVVFADHYGYTRGDMDRLLRDARAAGATAVITTEKDRVRVGSLAATFPAELPLRTARLRVEIEEEAAVGEWLMERLGAAAAHPTL